jgi:GNAT superfamily N-acetyltransferase
LWRVIVKLVSPLGDLGINILYAKDLTAEIPPVAPRVAATIRLGTEADVEALLTLQRYKPGDDETGEQRSKYLDRLRRGETCFLVCVGSELVAFDWMCRQWGEAIPAFPIVLDPGECYGAEAFTSPLWRGLGLHKYVNNYMLRFAQSLGCRRCYTTADLVTWRSRRNLRWLGWQVFGVVLWCQLWRTGKVFAFRLMGDIDVFARAQSAERIDALMRRLSADVSRPG